MGVNRPTASNRPRPSPPAEPLRSLKLISSSTRERVPSHRSHDFDLSSGRIPPLVRSNPSSPPHQNSPQGSSYTPRSTLFFVPPSSPVDFYSARRVNSWNRERVNQTFSTPTSLHSVSPTKASTSKSIRICIARRLVLAVRPRHPPVAPARLVRPGSAPGLHTDQLLVSSCAGISSTSAAYARAPCPCEPAAPRPSNVGETRATPLDRTPLIGQLHPTPRNSSVFTMSPIRSTSTVRLSSARANSPLRHGPPGTPPRRLALTPPFKV